MSEKDLKRVGTRLTFEEEAALQKLVDSKPYMSKASVIHLMITESVKRAEHDGFDSLIFKNEGHFND